MFTVTDKDGYEVSLTKETWLNKLLHPSRGHPEIKDYLHGIQLTLQDPDFISQSVRDERSKLFYKAGVTSGKYRHCYILVVVKYVREPTGVRGYVSTAMLTDHIKKRGGLLWEKSTN